MRIVWYYGIAWEGVFKINIGDRIKQRRIELGIEVDDLAKKIGKSRATIYRYENGDIRDMPTTILEPIAKALQCSPAYLMGWDDTPPTSQNPHIEKYYQLNNDNQQTVNNLIDDLSEKQKADDKFREALRELEEKNKQQALLIAFGGKKQLHEFTDEELADFHKYLEEYKSQNLPKWLLSNIVETLK